MTIEEAAKTLGDVTAQMRLTWAEHEHMTDCIQTLLRAAQGQQDGGNGRDDRPRCDIPKPTNIVEFLGAQGIKDGPSQLN